MTLLTQFAAPFAVQQPYLADPPQDYRIGNNSHSGRQFAAVEPDWWGGHARFIAANGSVGLMEIRAVPPRL